MLWAVFSGRNWIQGSRNPKKTNSLKPRLSAYKLGAGTVLEYSRIKTKRCAGKRACATRNNAFRHSLLLFQFYDTNKSSTASVNRWSFASSFALLQFFKYRLTGTNGWRQYANAQINSNNYLSKVPTNARWLISLTAYHTEIIKTEKTARTVAQEVLLE